MNTFFKTLTLGIALTTFGAQAQNTEAPYLTKTFTASQIKNLKMRTSGGSLSVAGQTGSEAKLEVYIQQNNWNGRSKDQISKEEIAERLKEYDLTIQQSGDSLIAIVKRKRDNWSDDDWKRSLSISFKAYVPEKINTDVRTSGGSILMENLTGNIGFGTSGGSLKARKLGGVVRGKTSGGSIDVSNCKDDLELTTSGGSIHAENSEGNLNLRTSGGSMDLNGLKGNINARTSGGSIDANGLSGEMKLQTSGSSIHLRAIAGTLDASTSGGSIDAEVIELGKSLSLRTSAGSVTLRMPLDKGLDLDLRANKITANLNNFNGDTDDNRIKGALNGGGIPVRISVSSGNLYLKSSK